MSIPDLARFMNALRSQTSADPQLLSGSIREGLDVLERFEPQSAAQFKARLAAEDGETFLLGACRSVLELAMLFEGEDLLIRKGHTLWVGAFIDRFFEECRFDEDVKPILKAILKIEYTGKYFTDIERRLS